MAYRQNPNDPFVDPPLERPLPGDPILTEDPRFEKEEPVSGTRVALYAVAVLALVGALFYGMSMGTNTDTAQNPPTSSMSERAATPPPAVRDVTPRNNTAPGMTTGSAPSQSAPAAPTPVPAPADAK